MVPSSHRNSGREGTKAAPSALTCVGMEAIVTTITVVIGGGVAAIGQVLVPGVRPGVPVAAQA